MKNNSKSKGFFNDKRFNIILSLLLAIITWIVVVIYIDPETQKVISKVPVDFDYNSSSYESQGLDILNRTQVYVDVLVEGDGYAVESLRAEDFTVYPSYTQVKGAGKYELEMNYKEQGSQKYKVQSMSPSTVTLQFDKIEEKKMPITVAISGIEPDIGYFMDAPIAAPAEVTLRGPVTEISRVAKVVANVVSTEKRKESSIKTASLEMQDKDGTPIVDTLITMDKQQVEVNIPILEEREIPISIAYIGMPTGFDTAWLDSRLKLSDNKIRVAGPSKLWDTLPTLNIGYVDLTKFVMDGEYSFPVTLPEGFVNMDKLLSVTATFNTDGLVATSVNVTDVRTSGATAQGLTLNVPSRAKVNNVVLIGPKEEIKELNPINVIAQIDATNVSKITGQQNVPVQILVPSSSKIFASGNYTVLCDTTVDG
ncbi:MAG: CdaR family protein [Oscillospiraceae bacterium]